jgi:hypothetical protein
VANWSTDQYGAEIEPCAEIYVIEVELLYKKLYKEHGHGVN